ncbi:hypothetical protein ACVXZY_14185 [Staphylococcus aureus]
MSSIALIAFSNQSFNCDGNIDHWKMITFIDIINILFKNVEACEFCRIGNVTIAL